MQWTTRNGVHQLVGTPYTLEQSEPDDAIVYRGTKPAFSAGSLSEAKAAAERMWVADQRPVSRPA